MHDAAVWLGAKCDGGCGLFSDEAAADSAGKSYTELRAQALTFLVTPN